ncbi:MAG: hypothetical protein R6V76_12970 [Desulfobacterales bacterium]
MNRLIIVSICAITLFVTGCLPSVKNLHVHDRIPQEQQKGYVQFISNVQKDNVRSIPYVFEYVISEKKHNHMIPIHTGPIQIQSPPISDRIGRQTYLIRYPTRVISNTLEEYNSRFARQALQGLIPRFLEAAMSKVVWIDESKVTEDDLNIKLSQAAVVVYQTKQIEIPIEPDKITPVSIVYRISRDNQSNANSGNPAVFRGEITSLKAEPSYPVKNVVKIKRVIKVYPTRFADDYKTVFTKTIDTANNLEWEILHKNESDGQLILKKNRFGANPLVFSVGVYSDESGKTNVDISSDLPWQRWGSMNTELSLKHMNEFYTVLNDLLKKQ